MKHRWMNHFKIFSRKGPDEGDLARIKWNKSEGNMWVCSYLFLLRIILMATSSLFLWSRHFRTCPKEPFPITSSTSNLYPMWSCSTWKGKRKSTMTIWALCLYWKIKSQSLHNPNMNIHVIDSMTTPLMGCMLQFQPCFAVTVSSRLPQWGEPQ